MPESPASERLLFREHYPAAKCIVPGADNLVSEFNRDGDVNKPASRWTHLAVPESAEAAAIARLMDDHERYTDSAPYVCVPEEFAGFYNSNSYARTLLEYAEVPHSPRQPLSPSPGWLTIIPKRFFPAR